ncbi:hypothetical protein [Chryseobacterium daecheongense]|uniref:DUF4384 domain-containing protein n=1 Tax=Chryseobacterium daecheongense TaxID=192389 RepID=A0A3N0VS83_9FLAO|nr:hypothetical protein [Chryseobacterium daecheongense]ROH95624.1 hypothetical protein EGI05_13905 [Chryseobacterium daecheongense]TDX91998.1 hypothetical protein BCF50_3140 [Chryseobacterium daecheongense]
MKKLITSIFIVSFIALNAQNGPVLTKNDIADGSTFSNRIRSENSGGSLTYDDVVGSPYLNKMFVDAKIAENYEKVYVRYNSYADQVEFERDGKTLVLPKESKFSRIEILSPKQTLVLLETNDEFSGYFFELAAGPKYSLYKKLKTKFVDAVPANSSYTSDKPANFKLLDPIYYIKTSNGFIKKPRNQKDIIAQLPEMKDSLTEFFKSNKIKFDREEDLIKLVKFLNQ